MPPLNEKGFLGNSITDWICKIRANHSQFFELADEANQLCQKSMFELEPHSRHLQELLVASLYMRSISNYQGILLLAERGMMPEARTMARAMVEVLFSLCAIGKNQELARDYVREDQKNRLKFLNKFRELHGGKLPSGITEGEIKALEKELKDDIAKNQINTRTTEQWAIEAGMRDWYLTAYSMLSLSVHSKVRDLEHYLIRDKTDQIREFKWGPDDTGIKEILVTAIEGILVALNCTSKVFQRNKDADIKNLYSRLQELVKNMSAEPT